MPTASAESPLQSAAVAHCLTDNLDSTWKSSFITLRWRLPQSGLSPTFWQPAHQQSASRPPVTASARDRPRLIVPALSLSLLAVLPAGNHQPHYITRWARDSRSRLPSDCLQTRLWRRIFSLEIGQRPANRSALPRLHSHGLALLTRCFAEFSRPPPSVPAVSSSFAASGPARSLSRLSLLACLFSPGGLALSKTLSLLLSLLRTPCKRSESSHRLALLALLPGHSHLLLPHHSHPPL